MRYQVCRLTAATRFKYLFSTLTIRTLSMRLSNSLLALSKPSKVLCFSVIVSPSFIPVKHGFMENSALVVFRINLIFWYWKRNHMFIFILPCSILSMKPPLDVSSRECTFRGVPSGEYTLQVPGGVSTPPRTWDQTYPSQEGTWNQTYTPAPWTERHLWKHYVPWTAVAGGKNGCVMWIFEKLQALYVHFLQLFS